MVCVYLNDAKQRVGNNGDDCIYLLLLLCVR